MLKTGLATSLGPLELSNKLFIGAGAIKTIEDVKFASEIDDLGLILIGSYTIPAKDGNSGNVYYYDPVTRTSINSIGLKNGGKEYLKKYLKEMVKISEDNGKILGLSVSGETPEENVELINMAIDYGARYFEVNTACGNVMGDDRRSKPIACYNHTAMERMFEAMTHIHFNKDMHYKTFKVGKFPNFADIDGLAKLHAHYDVFDGVVTTNTEKSKIIGPDGRAVLDPDNGFGGLGGEPLKRGALGQVSKWREVLPIGKDVIGIGGIFTGADMTLYENHGASAMQYTTAYLLHGNPDRGAQSRIITEYFDLYQEQIS
jgi:dihydroorotate dehydrogenase